MSLAVAGQSLLKIDGFIMHLQTPDAISVFWSDLIKPYALLLSYL